MIPSQPIDSSTHHSPRELYLEMCRDCEVLGLSPWTVTDSAQDLYRFSNARYYVNGKNVEVPITKA